MPEQPEPDTTRLVYGVRRRWRTVVIGAVAGAALLLAAARLTSDSAYQTTVRLGAVDDSSLVAAMDLPPQLSVRRLPLSAEASRIESSEFRAKVSKDLGRKLKVVAAADSSTNTLVVDATQPTADQAAEAATAVVTEVVTLRKAELASDIEVANAALDATLTSLGAQRAAIDDRLGRSSNAAVTDAALIAERTKVVELEAKAQATKVSLAQYRDNNAGRLQLLSQRTDQVSGSGIPQAVAGLLLGGIVGAALALVLASTDRRVFARRDVEAAVDGGTVLAVLAQPTPAAQVELARQILARHADGGVVDLLPVDDAAASSSALTELATALGSGVRVVPDAASVTHPVALVAQAGATFRESVMIASADLDSKGATVAGVLLLGVKPAHHRYAAS